MPAARFTFRALLPYFKSMSQHSPNAPPPRSKRRRDPRAESEAPLPRADVVSVKPSGERISTRPPPRTLPPRSNPPARHLTPVPQMVREQEADRSEMSGTDSQVQIARFPRTPSNPAANAEQNQAPRERSVEWLEGIVEAQGRELKEMRELLHQQTGATHRAEREAARLAEYRLKLEADLVAARKQIAALERDAVERERRTEEGEHPALDEARSRLFDLETSLVGACSERDLAMKQASRLALQLELTQAHLDDARSRLRDVTHLTHSLRLRLEELRSREREMDRLRKETHEWARRAEDEAMSLERDLESAIEANPSVEARLLSSASMRPPYESRLPALPSDAPDSVLPTVTIERISK